MRLQGFVKPACLMALSLAPGRTQDSWRDLKAAVAREEVWNPRPRPCAPEALKDAGRMLLISPAPDWILLDPAGEMAAQGTGEPDPRRIRARMDEAGWGSALP